MSQKERLTIVCEDELYSEVEEVQEREGHDHKSDVGRELLERGVEEWHREHTDYPGSEWITNGVQVAALAVVIGSPVSIALKSGMAYESVGVLAATMAVFLVAHTTGVVWARWNR
jgi:hypothetical protein